MKVSLRTHNKVREDGKIVDDITKEFIQSRLLHETHIPEAYITITFKLRGILSYYPTRLETEYDIQMLSCYDEN